MTIKTAGAALIAGLVLTACDNALLDFQDPDIISSVNSASGAIALMNGVRERLVTVTTGETPTSHESLIFFGGLLADEWKSGDSFVERNSTDRSSWPVRRRPGKRRRGEIETQPSGSLRVRVYGGIDPVAANRHYLTVSILVALCDTVRQRRPGRLSGARP